MPNSPTQPASAPSPSLHGPGDQFDHPASYVAAIPGYFAECEVTGPHRTRYLTLIRSSDERSVTFWGDDMARSFIADCKKFGVERAMSTCLRMAKTLPVSMSLDWEPCGYKRGRAPKLSDFTP